MRAFLALLFACLVSAAPQQSLAGEDPRVEAEMVAYVKEQFAEWISGPILWDAIHAQNRRTQNLTQTDIDRLDTVWRAEFLNRAHPLVGSVMNNDVSAYLKEHLPRALGKITEIIVMDSRGLNVAQTAPTSDYWQGDESKYTKTYLIGPHGLHVAPVEQGQAPYIYQKQISLSVVDPISGTVIGAVTVTLDAEPFY